MSTLSDTNSINIKLVKDLAKKTYPDNSIMAQLAATQAVHESNLLRAPSRLAKIYNNLFGIKGKGTKGTVTLTTNEVILGQVKTLKDGFAYNNSLEDSFEQYKKVLSLPRYVKVHQAKTFEEAAKAVQAAGYATDPSYAKLLVQVRARLGEF